MIYSSFGNLFVNVEWGGLHHANVEGAHWIFTLWLTQISDSTCPLLTIIWRKTLDEFSRLLQKKCNWCFTVYYANLLLIVAMFKVFTLRVFTYYQLVSTSREITPCHSVLIFKAIRPFLFVHRISAINPFHFVYSTYLIVLPFPR